MKTWRVDGRVSNANHPDTAEKIESNTANRIWFAKDAIYARDTTSTQRLGRAQRRTRVPSANKDAVSDAKDDFHEKFIHIKSEVENMKENLASRIDVSDNRQKIVQLESDMEEVKKVVMEIGQKVGHVENDVGDMKRELADFRSMQAALASLQEQLQMLLNGYIMPGAF